MIRRSEKFDNKRRRFAAKALSWSYKKGGLSHQGGLPCVVSAAWQGQECCSWTLASALAISRPLAFRAGLQRRERSTRRSNIPASPRLLTRRQLASHGRSYGDERSVAAECRADGATAMSSVTRSLADDRVLA